MSRVQLYVCLDFYLSEGFNYPLGYSISPLWNGEGPNKQAILHCAPHHFSIGSCIEVYCCDGVEHHVGTSSKLGRDSQRCLEHCKVEINVETFHTIIICLKPHLAAFDNLSDIHDGHHLQYNHHQRRPENDCHQEKRTNDGSMESLYDIALP